MAIAEPLRQIRERTSEAPRPATRLVSKPDENETSDSPSLPGRLLVFVLVGLSMWVAYKVATGKYYTPRSNFGFYLGVVGSVMMLLMLAYPLRKHVGFMHRWGALKTLVSHPHDHGYRRPDPRAVPLNLSSPIH